MCVDSCLKLSLALGWPSQDRIWEMEEGERPALVHWLSGVGESGRGVRICEQPGGD